MSVFVNVSGTAFSLLLYENVRNDHDQEGFLLGEIIRNEKRTITDNDQDVVTIEHTIKINSVFPCPRLGHFFDNAGKIDPNKLDTLLGDKKDHVVSWYKFKRISSFKLTLREKIVMKQLAMYFMPQAPEHFTWCLLTARAGADNDEKHIFSQTFIRYHMSAYQPLPMHIANLKDPHDVYKKPEACSTIFREIVRGLPKKIHGYATVSCIETALDERIARTVEQMKTSEEEMHNLEQRVRELRTKLNTLDNDESLEDLLGTPETPVKTRSNLTSTSMSIKPRRSLRSAGDVKIKKEDNKEEIKEKAEDEQIEKDKKPSTNLDSPRVTRNSSRKS